MYNYSMNQWILFFFIYCFFGWIWECCYVAVVRFIKTKKWELVNRGFLNGPFLPIYGSAAMVILLATIPVKDHIPLVFFFGMAAATLLELVTGSVMERLFHVKYWDYSGLPFNYKGYICLIPSLFWGVCAVFLVHFIHVPIENLIFKIPEQVCEIGSLVLVGVFAWDFTTSFHEAMDIKALLEELSEHNVAFQRLERRADAIAAFVPVYEKQALVQKKRNTKERFLHNLEELRASRLAYLKQVREKLQTLELPERKKLQDLIDQQMNGISMRTNKRFLKAGKHLRRNPGAISRKYGDALRQIKDLLDK